MFFHTCKKIFIPLNFYFHTWKTFSIPLYKNFIPCKKKFHTFKFLFSYFCGLVSYLGYIFHTLWKFVLFYAVLSFHTEHKYFVPWSWCFFVCIPNRYENLAPGMKQGHLGMKQIPRVWKKTMAVLSQTSCIPYVLKYTKMVWKCCSRYEKSSFGYETNAKGMKSLHDGMKQMTNVLKQTHLWRMPDLRAIVLDGLDASVHPSVFQTPPCIPCIGRPHGVSWCGGFPSLGSLGTRLICLVWPNHILCPTLYY